VSRALLKSRVGDVVRFESPRGAEELDIVDVRYEPISD
jgi:transcription elongation GreA/GreB family factor